MKLPTYTVQTELFSDMLNVYSSTDEQTYQFIFKNKFDNWKPRYEMTLLQECNDYIVQTLFTHAKTQGTEIRFKFLASLDRVKNFFALNNLSLYEHIEAVLYIAKNPPLHLYTAEYRDKLEYIQDYFDTYLAQYEVYLDPKLTR